jgi:hypothetical protein
VRRRGDKIRNRQIREKIRDIDGVEAAEGTSGRLGCWRTWRVEDSEECIVVGRSVREAGDRYRRVIDRSNKKVKGVALVVCREINMIDKIEIGE